MKKYGFIFCLIGLFSLIVVGCGKNEKKAVKESSRSVTTSISTVESSQAITSTSSSAINTSSTSTTIEAKASSEVQTAALTDAQKRAISADFLVWAGERAKIGNMAVSDWYFDHGAAGIGDWYAETPNGKVQVQDFGVPGAAAFPIHAIGGVIFYTAKDGTIGIDPKLSSGSFADNYETNLNRAYPVSKYILGDDGIIYELKADNGNQMSTNTGFMEGEDNGSFSSYQSTPFIVSEDEAAQAELVALISQYVK